MGATHSRPPHHLTRLRLHRRDDAGIVNHNDEVACHDERWLLGGTARESPRNLRSHATGLGFQLDGDQLPRWKPCRIKDQAMTENRSGAAGKSGAVLEPP